MHFSSSFWSQSWCCVSSTCHRATLAAFSCPSHFPRTDHWNAKHRLHIQPLPSSWGKKKITLLCTFSQSHRIVPVIVGGTSFFLFSALPRNLNYASCNNIPCDPRQKLVPRAHWKAGTCIHSLSSHSIKWEFTGENNLCQYWAVQALGRCCTSKVKLLILPISMWLVTVLFTSKVLQLHYWNLGYA